MPNGSYTSTIKHFRKKNKVLGLFWFGVFFGGVGCAFLHFKIAIYDF